MHQRTVGRIRPTPDRSVLSARYYMATSVFDPTGLSRCASREATPARFPALAIVFETADVIAMRAPFTQGLAHLGNGNGALHDSLGGSLANLGSGV
jgi:hypothetical protein